MTIFEKYHPIMTAHYTLDWLTGSNIKEIFALRHDKSIAQAADRQPDSTIMDTARYVNSAMGRVMRNEMLIWAIQDRKSNTFLGTFELGPFSETTISASVHYELLAQFQRQGVMTEVLQHIVQFSFEELKLTELTAITTKKNKPAQKLLERVGFKSLINESAEHVHYSLQASPVSR
ncbi:hypothetical protein BSQ39_01270 [Loigolactobacillus backii]|uniref:GNAT family N-acetyltransferase n=1 Tax=Loigolactobacillus backii TaxID=375175 RepID=UPI000C1C9DC5|nr:GNAT family N-acetyltransferase [Loigolactobacillus backii]PIO82287.1 hypothetical protein BSQ39_01270 [Loigolactobacillus backii]